MKRIHLALPLVATFAAITSCHTTKEEKTTPFNQDQFPPAPVAERISQTFENFGEKRTDPYYWLKDKTNPKVIEYLKAENAYTDTVMASTKKLQETIYNEILGRIKEDDQTYPTFDNGYYYYNRSEKGKQYLTYCRRKGSMEAAEEVFFDVNQMAEGKNAFIFEGYFISPDNQKAAYLYNETGSYAEYTLKIRDLSTGSDINFRVEGVASVAWANDSKTLFYSTIDKSLRSHQIHRQVLDAPNSELLYQEDDARFSTYVSADKLKRHIWVFNESSSTSETRYLSADNPTQPLKVFLPRTQGVEYAVYPHKDYFFLRYKDDKHLNGEMYKLPLVGYTDHTLWKEFLAHDPNTRIEGIDVLKDYVVVSLRKNGLTQLEALPVAGGEKHVVSFPEPVYSVSLKENPMYDSGSFRYSYTSLNRPTTLYEYEIAEGKSNKLKEQEVPSGFNPDDYTVERLWATAPDGVKVPMAVVYKKGLKRDGSAPALLYSYGSYGSNSRVYFSTSYYSLIDRGFVFAIAQIRGGSDLGEQWYEDGKLLHKKNTFTDFIACSELLIKDKYTSADKLAIAGGSAGGLLMGAVTNMRPDLYHTVVAQVPFVDVVTTMLDDTLPLTTGEYEEWGNPNEEEYFRYMLSYSPYDNIKAQNYPNMLVTGGLNDSQVLFHEPAKYVAKLRSLKTDKNLLLLHMDMDSGYGGATGRYGRIKDTAFEFAFILKCIGIEK